MNKFIVGIFSIFIVSSCATSNVSKSFKLEEGSSNGVVIGSITYEGGYSGYAISYNQLPSGVSGKFQSGQSNILIPYFPTGEFEFMGIEGNLIAAELPEGDYEINSWNVGSGSASVKPTVPFSIKFHVSPGKAVYIGNFHFTQLARMGFAVTGAKVDYREKSERDLSVLKTNYLGLAEVPVESSIASGENTAELGGKYHTTITILVPIIQ